MGVVGLVVVLLVIVGGLWFANGHTVAHPDNCEAGGPTGITVIAIDATDVLNEIQRLALRNELTDIVERLPVNEGVQIWRVAPSEGAVPDAAGPLICKPERTGNPWRQNPKQVERRYVVRFQEAVFNEIDEFIKAGSEPQSPIMESIQAIAIRTFDLPEYHDVRRRTLVVASDLMQNTSTLTQLHGVEPFEKFAATQNYRRVVARLAGVHVELLYLQRTNSPPFKRHIEFWQRYFADAGATVERVKPVAGVS
jgi:hypothetical protein